MGKILLVRRRCDGRHGVVDSCVDEALLLTTRDRSFVRFSICVSADWMATLPALAWLSRRAPKTPMTATSTLPSPKAPRAWMIGLTFSIRVGSLSLERLRRLPDLPEDRALTVETADSENEDHACWESSRRADGLISSHRVQDSGRPRHSHSNLLERDAYAEPALRSLGVLQGQRDEHRETAEEECGVPDEDRRWVHERGLNAAGWALEEEPRRPGYGRHDE